MKAAVPCGFRAAAGFAASRPRGLDADGIPPAPSRAGPVQEYIDPQNVPPAEELRGIRSVHDYEASFAKFPKQLRESATCSQCGSSSRQRQMTLILRRRIHARPLDRPIEFPHGFRTCNAESNGPLHERRSKLPGGRPLRVFRGSRPQRRHRQGHPARRPPAALLSRCFSGRRPFELGSGRRIVVCAVATSRRDINTRPTPLTRLPRCQHARDVLAGHARDARSCCCAPRKTIIAGSPCHIASADAACARPRRFIRAGAPIGRVEPAGPPGPDCAARGPPL